MDIGGLHLKLRGVFNKKARLTLPSDTATPQELYLEMGVF